MLHRIIRVFYCFFFLNLTAIAQEEHEQFQKNPGLELVVSGLSIYNTETNHSDYATEIHLTYWTTHQWAFGVGYTLVFEEENNLGNEIAALVSHKRWSFLTINAGPSVLLPTSHNRTEISAYLETEFAFKIKNIHMGPTIGILAGAEFRNFGGWHFSYEF